MELSTAVPGDLDAAGAPDANLPDPGREPSKGQLLPYYRSLLKKARDLKESEVSVPNWDIWLRAYRNKFQAVGTTINQVYSNGKVVVPSASYRNPRVVLTPFVNPMLWFHAKVQERIDNWLLDRMALGDLTKALNLDVYVCGRAFVKTGFSSQWGGQTLDDTPPEFRRFDYGNLVRSGEPWCLRVDPRNVWVIGGPFWNDVRYLFHRVYRSYEDIRADKRYDGPGVRDLAPARALEGLADSGGSVFDAPTTGQSGDRWRDIPLIEFWDKKRRTYGVFAASGGGTGDDISRGGGRWVQRPRQFAWWPWDSLAWNPDGVHFWPASDVNQFWPQQVEMNRTREQLRRHGQIALVKLLVLKGAFEEGELDKFFSNKIGVHVECHLDDLAKAVKAVSVPIPQELFQLLKECKLDIRSILGHSENVMGAYVPKSRVTAAETEEVGAGTDLRLSDRKSVMESFIVRATKRLHAITALGWQDADHGNDMVVRGPDEIRRLVSWTMADLRDLLGGVEVAVEDRPSLTKLAEKSEILEMLQIMQGDPNVSAASLQKTAMEYVGGTKPLAAGKTSGTGSAAGGPAGASSQPAQVPTVPTGAAANVTRLQNA